MAEINLSDARAEHARRTVIVGGEVAALEALVGQHDEAIAIEAGAAQAASAPADPGDVDGR